MQPPRHAEIIVIGGGIIGCSTAYHLAKLGKRDVVLLERSKLGCGTTWHSAAMVRQLRSTISLTQLIQYSVRLYNELERETGQSTGWMQCGSLSIATSKDRLTHIRRQASLANAFGIKATEVGRDDIQKLWPIAYTKDVIAGIHSTSDGRVSPTDTLAALVKGAKQRGVRFYEDTSVTGFTVTNGRIAGVTTAEGQISCDTIVLCAGLWSRELAKGAGVSVPLQACEHLALITKPFPGIYNSMPILGDHDNHMYIRDEAGGLMVGCFEPNAKPIDLSELPAGFSFGLLDEDWDRFEPIMKGAIHRIPALETAEVRMLLNGPESFTLDNNFMLGETPELRGFFLCCGMNSVGMASAGGAGRALAEWVVNGEPSSDLSSIDIRRFGRIRNNISVLRERAPENLTLHYALSTLGREFATGRNLRQTPLHSRLAAHHAFFGDRAGWERASWFHPAGRHVENEMTFGRPAWFDCVSQEHRAAREKVAIFDQSTFGKLLVQGRDSEKFLQRVCAADIAGQPWDRAIYSPVLNKAGGYESDIVIQRHAAETFLVTTGVAQTYRDTDLLRRRIEPNEFVVVTDVTSAIAVLSVMGPLSRTLLKRISPERFDNESFPYYTHREIEVGGTVVRAARLSYVGELGWELYTPSEAAGPLYDILWDAGQDLGLRDAGTFALGSLRVEKAYCSWGHDIGPTDTPLEAGLGFSTKLRKSIDFIGRQALERQAKEGFTKRRISIALDDPSPVLLGSEPVVLNGAIVGQVTSAAYGHSLGRSVGIAFIRQEKRQLDEALSTGRWEIEIALERHAAKASLQPFYDPKGARLRADDIAN